MDSYSYTYDNAGNQIAKTEVINGATKKGTTSYTYDELNGLLTVTEQGGAVTTYSYDAAGNRIHETVVNGSDAAQNSYVYDNQNRLTSVSPGLINLYTKTY